VYARRGNGKVEGAGKKKSVVREKVRGGFAIGRWQSKDRNAPLSRREDAPLP